MNADVFKGHLTFHLVSRCFLIYQSTSPSTIHRLYLTCCLYKDKMKDVIILLHELRNNVTQSVPTLLNSGLVFYIASSSDPIFVLQAMLTTLGTTAVNGFQVV